MIAAGLCLGCILVSIGLVLMVKDAFNSWLTVGAIGALLIARCVSLFVKHPN
jgi:hypothetical protein